MQLMFGLMPTPPNGEARTLYLQDLACDAEIGVYAHEMGRKQRILVNLAVRIVQPMKPVEDDFANVLDYSQLRAGVHKIVQCGHIQLQETLCEAIAAYCLNLPGVQSVYVRVGKLEAFDDCAAVGCELLRHKQAEHATDAPDGRIGIPP